MIPINQTIFEYGNGNCLQAVVASILEVPLENIPHFIELAKSRGGESSSQGLWEWAYDNKFEILYSSKIEDVPENIKFFIASGESPRSTVDKPLRHAVVFSKNGLEHDPHPSKSGLKKDPDLFIWFYKN